MCDALTNSGRQCKRRGRFYVPNMKSGTVGKNDWKYGRHVELCQQHVSMPRPLALIEGGFLQPYNRYGYGTSVFDTIIDWNNPPNQAFMPKFWYNKKI
jgi:hypothetical protein